MNLLGIDQDDVTALLRAGHRNDFVVFNQMLGSLARSFQVAKGSVLLSCIDNARNTVAHKAAEFGHTQILDIAISDDTWPSMPAQRLAFFETKNRNGDTVANVCARFGTIDYLSTVCQYGISLNSYNLAHRTPLLVAIFARADTNDDAEKAQLLEMIKFLIKRRVDLQSVTAIGDSAVHLAIRQQDKGLARLLLSSGASANARHAVDAPLHLAVRTGRLDLVQLLLDYGADRDQRSQQGDTPLHAALRAADLTFVVNIVSVLVERGASPAMRNRHGLTVWELARLKDIDEVHAWFLNRYVSNAV